MYGLTRSADGVKRLTMNVEFRITIEELAVLCTAQGAFDLIKPDGDNQPDLVRIRRELPNRRAALKLAVECLRQKGVEAPFYQVGDDKLENVVAAVRSHLDTLWTKQD